MCGIGGLVKSNGLSNQWTGEFLQQLALLLADRGEDATGCFTSEGAGVVRKAPGAAKDFHEWPTRFGRVNLVHTRQGTGGDPKNILNDHPLVGQKMVLIHNGTCSRMDRITDYPYQGECDSEILLSHLETKGIVEGIKSLKGTGAFAICNKTHPDKLWLYSWKNPLSVAWVNGYGIIFASTMEILRKHLGVQFKRAHGLFLPAFIYKMDDGELLELDVATMNFTRTVQKPEEKELPSIYWGGDEYEAFADWRSGKTQDWRNPDGWERGPDGAWTYKPKKEKEKKNKGQLYLCNGDGLCGVSGGTCGNPHGKPHKWLSTCSAMCHGKYSCMPYQKHENKDEKKATQLCLVGSGEITSTPPNHTPAESTSHYTNAFACGTTLRCACGVMLTVGEAYHRIDSIKCPVCGRYWQKQKTNEYWYNCLSYPKTSVN
jgi:hypothetical protein